jgi:hypothetical protein
MNLRRQPYHRFCQGSSSSNRFCPPIHGEEALGAAKDVGGFRVSADGKGDSGTGKPDQAKHTICRGRPHPKNPRYSGFRGLFGVCCLRMQRLGSSVRFGTGTRVAPNKNPRKRGGSSRRLGVGDAPAVHARALRNCAWTVSYVRMEALVRRFRLMRMLLQSLERAL